MSFAVPGREVRTWVVGPGLGDAYGVSVLLLAQLERRGRGPGLRIFATDSDPAAVEAARTDWFHADPTLGLSPARLRRYFFQDGQSDGWRARSKVRDAIVFGCHDVIRDPAYSNIDLVVHRLPRTRDARWLAALLGVFCRALRPGGYLFLGRPIPAAAIRDRLEPVVPECGIYRRPSWVPQRQHMNVVRLPHDPRSRAESPGEGLDRLIGSMETATVSLDREQRIQWFNATAAALLSLLPTDRGRLFQEVAQAVSENLLADVDAVLRGEVSVARSLSHRGGHWFVQSVRSLRRPHEGTDEVVVSIHEIPGERRSELELAALSGELEQEVARHALHLRLMRQAADIANRTSTLDQALAETLSLVGRHGGWVLGRAVLANADDPTTFADAGVWWAAPGRRFDEFIHRSERMRYRPSADPLGEVLRDGRARWVSDLASVPSCAWTRHAIAGGLRSALLVPIVVQGGPQGALKFYACEPTQPDELQRQLTTHIAAEFGRALERHRFILRLNALADEEWRRLAQELHDGIGQQLSGVGMLATGMLQNLRTAERPEPEKLAAIARGIDDARAQVRALTKGLLPIQLRADELRRALEELAAHFTHFSGVELSFTAKDSPVVSDDAVASHLHRIAQEAVRNAIQHGHARHVSLVLAGRDPVVLEIADDGVGMDGTQSHPGSGLRIMRYRAGLIGATLTITRSPQGGVLVSCSVPQTPRPRRARGIHRLRGRSRSEAGHES